MIGRQAGKLALAAIFCTGIAAAQPARPLPARSGPVPLDAPSATITNGLLAARVYLADPARGFYRGTRFDQSGVVGSLTYHGQNFYGPWFDRVSPDVHDFVFTPDRIVAGPDSAISGPVEEFAPLGFDTAPPGGTFIKIGVGVLKRPDAAVYDHYHHYEIVDPGRREVHVTKNAVTFTQTMRADANGFRYVKTLRLVPGKPQMRIEHVLTNLGTEPIATAVYDHNFLKLSPGNADVAITLPFGVVPGAPYDPALVRVKGNRIVFARPLKGTERAAFPVAGFSGMAKDYDIRVDDTRTGAGARVTADQPLSDLHFWSIRSVMAIEPYIAIAIPPGGTKRWTYTYTYTRR